MPRIKAFEGYLVKADHATQVVSPAYDAVSPEQRRLFAEKHPDNFLNTMRLLEDFTPETRPTADQLLALNKSCLDRLLDKGFFNKIAHPCIFIYRLSSGKHTQTGVVCEVGIEEYERNKLKKHENTRSDKEDLLAHYQKIVGVSSSPICLAYAQKDDIDNLINDYIRQPPDLEFVSEDHVVQKIWCIEDTEKQNALNRSFSKVDVTYLTDGHHRAASGRRYAEIMRAENGNSGNEPYNQLLVALFPDNQLNLLPFHRCVKDTNGLSESQLIAQLESDFEITAHTGGEDFQPARHGEFGMFAFGRWYRLKIKEGRVNHSDPVLSLDVSILQDLILDPILGIKDIRSDPRLDYIAGVSGKEGIVQKHGEGWAITFTCHATSIDQLMNVADADALMPPKSTYFDPKPRSGIFVRLK